ncbi:hypothetical protein AAG906_020395 [Vitis piasezkii]
MSMRSRKTTGRRTSLFGEANINLADYSNAPKPSHVSGIIKPRRMTLLLGPPSSGRLDYWLWRKTWFRSESLGELPTMAMEWLPLLFRLVSMIHSGGNSFTENPGSSAKVPLEKKPVDYGQDGEDRRSK